MAVASVAQFVERLVGQGDVWFAPMEEIAAFVRGLVDAGRWVPRRERVPQYERPVMADKGPIAKR